MIKPEDMTAEWQDGYGEGLKQGKADAVEEMKEELKYQMDFLSGIPQCYMARIFTMIEAVAEQMEELDDGKEEEAVD